MLQSKDTEFKELDEEFKTLRKDHEDLLVLLTDTDHKLKHYRKKVAATGEAVRLVFHLYFWFQKQQVSYFFMSLQVSDVSSSSEEYSDDDDDDDKVD